MKKFGSLLLFSIFVVLCFSSCLKSEERWRDKNIAFINQIKIREGIKEVGDSLSGHTGMYYEVLKEGTGVKPKGGAVVSVTYDGWVYNDTITYTKNHPLLIKESIESGDDFQFRVGGTVIDGWNLAIQYMPVGSKWRLYIPYYLGYGTMPQSDAPSYSSLIFDVTLVKIVSDN